MFIDHSTSLPTFCMRASNLFLIKLIFKCTTSSLFKFILRVRFKWLISLPLDLYSTLLLNELIAFGAPSTKFNEIH